MMFSRKHAIKRAKSHSLGSCSVRKVPMFMSSALLSALTVMSSAQANDDWWFDVEVIVFERKLSLSELDEQFEFVSSLATPDIEADVIGDVIRPDIRWIKQNLPSCTADTPPPYPEESLITLTFDDAIPSDEIAEQDSPHTPEVESPEVIQPFATQREEASPSSAEELSVYAKDYGPSADTIAGYWLSFYTEENALFNPVTVPETQFCEPAFTTDTWLSFEQGEWQTHYPDNRLPAPAALPITPEGNDWPYASHAHLLPASAQELTSLSRQIRQNRELTRLLHVVWRQPVMFGKDNAFNVRLFAGKNYADSYDIMGNPIQTAVELGSTLADESGENDDSVENDENKIQLNEDASPTSDSLVSSGTQNDIFSNLEKRLAQPTPVEFDHFTDNDAHTQSNDELLKVDAAFRPPIWQLDGNVKVFLKYINRVPYLHIDSNLFYRQPIPLSDLIDSDKSGSANNTFANQPEDGRLNSETLPEYKLASVPFSEQRRVISKQLHYFDHPLFGMIIELRRYQPPTAEKD